MTRLLPAFAILLFAAPLFAQRDAKTPDPDPELERKTFILPEGFEVNLWASDPLLAKPIQMNFDSKGRLWIAASEVYPQIKPGQKANDKILILEDTTGKGVADKTTVFADGLLIPTGVEPDNKGGAYVADSTDLVYFSEPGKDGKATKRRIVLSGFGTEDTHHILHTLRHGPDGLLYMSQSIYIHSHIETPHGVKRLNAGGIWQFRPETEKLEVFARGWVNTWGTAWDKYGATFATDGAGGEGINYVVPGAAYVTARDVARILPGLNPGSPKYCGLEVVSGSHLPADWQQNLITNDFRGHRVCRYIVQEDGSGFVAKEQKELIKSNHPAFRPIDVKMGPDGAIYIADWYNPIIQHGEVDFRDDRRDKTHGRIWRITAKGRPLVEKPKIDGAKIEDLLELLKSPEDWTRHHAKRELASRDKKEVLEKLNAWAAKQTIEQAKLEALWVYQALDMVEPGLLNDLLASNNPGVRAATSRVAGEWLADAKRPQWKIDVDRDRITQFGLSTEEIQNAISELRTKTALTVNQMKTLKLKNVSGQEVLLSDVAKIEEWNWPVKAIDSLNQRIRDDHPRVRLEAVRALAKVEKSASSISAALDQPVDKWLDYAIWQSLRETKDQWLPDVKSGKFDFGGDPKKLVFALRAAGENDVTKPLVKLLKGGKLTQERELDVLATLARIGGPVELGLVLNEATLKQEPMRGALYSLVESSVRSRKVAAPPDILPMLSVFAREGRGTSRQAAARLIGLWKGDDYRGLLEELASSERLATLVTDDDRRAAFDGLVSLGGPKSVAFLRSVSASKESFARRQAIVSLSALDAPAAANAAVKLIAAKDAADLEPIFAAFVNRKGGTAELVKALGDTALSADVAKIGIRVAKSNGQADPALVAALTKAGKLTETKRSFTKPELDTFLAKVKTDGDPKRGEMVYRRAELNCVKCHGIAGSGGQVGPDMTSIGASAQADYLVESLLNPNAKIKEGYNAIVVTTADDRVFSGIKIRETGAELVLRDAEGKEVVISKADRPEVKPGKSLMPDGLTDSLTAQEFLDLIRFLTELGKGEYLAQPGKFVRTWEMVIPNQDLFTAVTRDRLGAIATEPKLSWSPLYSTVSGSVLPEEITKWKIGGGEDQGAIRFKLDCTTAGKVLLKGNVANLPLWLDGSPLTSGKEVELDLKPGLHTITVSVPIATQSNRIIAEIGEVVNSKARVQIVGGK